MKKKYILNEQAQFVGCDLVDDDYTAMIDALVKLAPVRLTAYSNLSNNGSYIALNSTLDQSDFADKPIESVGYEDVKTVVKTMIDKEFTASSTKA